MKQILLIFLPLILIAPQISQGQSTPTPYDLSTIDGLLEAMYSSISGEKGEERDWETFRQLFTDDARLIATRQSEEGDFVSRSLTPEDYVKQSGPYLVENGFFEEEIHRRTDRFDPIAHVFSTYTTRNSREGPITARGINSVQLLNDGSRWWVVTIYWASEGEDRPIPEEYDNR